jgi:hypothetical protein
VCVSHIAYFSMIFAIIHVLACEFLIFLFCQFSCHIPGPTMWVSHFYCSWVLSPYSRFYCVHFSFSTFFSFLAKTQVLQFVFLHIIRIPLFFAIFGFYSVSFSFCLFFFSVFLPQSSFYTVCFSYLKFFTVSYHIPCPTVCVSHFTRFLVCFALFHVLLCEFLLFLVCQFSHHIPGSTVCNFHFSIFFNVSRHIPVHIVFVSHFPRFSDFFPKSRYYKLYFSIFHIFQCFSTYFGTYSVCFLFCRFFSGFFFLP